MKRVWVVTIVLAAMVAGGWAGAQQSGGSLLQKGVKAVKDPLSKAYDEMTFTEDEERQIGADISARLRLKYGVVQDAAVHKYVSLVGSVLGQISERPRLKWTFIVLDTDGINAFAAPGGFVHITRGALGLIRSEAELANILGHEIFHVTATHTLAAIRKAKAAGAFGKGMTILTRNDWLEKVADKGYELIIENASSADEEEDSDAEGIQLANRSGWAPTGLSTFLTRLAERNKDLVARSGLWASHPLTKDRIELMKELIEDEKLDKTALVSSRYASSIAYRSVAVSRVGQAPAPSTTEAKAEPAKGGLGRLGLSGLKSLGKQKSSDATIAATGTRGVNPDRDAKGGPNKALVVVTITTAEITAFKKGIVG